jgi:hypothetical protein
VKDEEAFRPAQAYDLGGVSTWFFGVDIHSPCARAYLSGVYAVVKGQARGIDLLVAHNVICAFIRPNR